MYYVFADKDFVVDCDYNQINAWCVAFNAKMERQRRPIRARFVPILVKSALTLTAELRKIRNDTLSGCVSSN